LIARDEDFQFRHGARVVTEMGRVKQENRRPVGGRPAK